MSRGEVRVVAPDDWLGIPERFPLARWQTVRDWAAEAIEELIEDLGTPEPEQQEAVIRFIVDMAEFAARVESRAYLLLEGWSGPYTTALFGMFPSSVLGEQSLEELARDPRGAVEAPMVEPFTTRGGLTGWNTTRYIQEDASGAVVARLDILVEVPGGFAGITSSTGDLVAFQRTRPAVEALGASIMPAG